MTTTPAEGSRSAHTRVARDQMRVLELAEGFFDSAVLFALVDLRIFESIGDDSKALAELADELGVREATLARLLNAGVALGLLESADGSSYALRPHVAAVLSSDGDETYLGDWIRNLDYFRSALAGLGEAVRRSAPTVDPMAHLGGDAMSTRDFSLAMHNYAALRGRELARFLDLSECESLLDLGCGPGTYAFHLGARNPHLTLYLLDLPDVLEVAKEVRDRFDLENEIHYLPVDVSLEEIPGTYDAVLVSNTLHMLGERESKRLIQRLHPTVAEGGSVVIQAQYLLEDRLGPRWPVLLDLIQLCITDHGRNHSVEETRAWLEEAGFVDVEHEPMTLVNTNSYLRAYKRS